MLIFDKVMLAAATILLILITVRLHRVKARRAQAPGEVRMLFWLQTGMAMTALSFFFRVADYSHPHHISYAGMVFGLAGAVLIAIATPEIVRMLAPRTQVPGGDPSKRR